MPTLRQERVAELMDDPRIKTKTELIEKAGYAPSTARAQQKQVLDAIGTKLAHEKVRRRQSGTARGILRLTLDQAHDEIVSRKLELKESVTVAVAMSQVLGNLDEDPEEDGNAARFRAWLAQHDKELTDKLTAICCDECRARLSVTDNPAE
jgi:hypothetical protein